MPIVRVEMLPGRTQEQKDAIVKGITEVMVKEAKTTAEGTHVLIYEVSADNWSVAGTMQSKRRK